MLRNCRYRASTGQLLVAGSAVFLVGILADGSSATGSELLERAFRNMYAEDYVQTLELETFPRSGRGMSRTVQVIRKQSADPKQAIVRFLAPASMRRTSLLIIERDSGNDDLYVYFPAARITRHLSASQRSDAFFGTDLSYEDVEPKSARDFLIEATATGELCTTLRMIPRKGYGSGYDEISACIDEELGVPHWMEFRVSGDLVKRLVVDLESVREIDERRVPFAMTMHDTRRGSRTVMETREYEVRAAIPDEIFSTWNLEAGSARRDRAKLGAAGSRASHGDGQ